MEKSKLAGWKRKSFVFLMIWSVVLNGCGSSKTEAPVGRTLPEESYEKSYEKETYSESLSRKEQETEASKVSGFHKKTNQTIEFHGIEVSFPAYFDVYDEASTEDFIHYYPEEKDYYCSLMLSSAHLEVSQEEFNYRRSELASSFIKSFGDGQHKITKTTDLTIAGLTGWTLSGRLEGKSTVHCSFFYLADSQELITIVESYDDADQSDYDYAGDYKKIIESVTLINGGGETKEISKETREAPASNGVNPDFKAMMDSYEEFFNSYVDFMKRYTESSNPIGMLKDYTDFMQKYVEVMDNLNSINETDLSTEDYKYYIDVYGRISKKLLEVYE